MFSYFSKEAREKRRIAKEAKRAAEQEAAQLAQIERENAIKAENVAYRQKLFEPLISVATSFSCVTFDGFTITFKSSTIDECKKSKKELTVLKKAANIEKKQINANYKNVKDKYAQQVGNQSSMAWTTGTGKFGTIVRAGVRANRAANRAQMANVRQLKESEIHPWDVIISAIDDCQLEVDRVLLILD